jgi:hypothetical protein
MRAKQKREREITRIATQGKSYIDKVSYCVYIPVDRILSTKIGWYMMGHRDLEHSTLKSSTCAFKILYFIQRSKIGKEYFHHWCMTWALSIGMAILSFRLSLSPQVRHKVRIRALSVWYLTDDSGPSEGGLLCPQPKLHRKNPKLIVLRNSKVL